MARPGDGGLCPICGRDMREIKYNLESIYFVGADLKVPVRQVSGRYWHMKNEHQVWEDYKIGGS